MGKESCAQVGTQAHEADTCTPARQCARKFQPLFGIRSPARDFARAHLLPPPRRFESTFARCNAQVGAFERISVALIWPLLGRLQASEF